MDKSGCKGAIFQSVNKQLYRFCFLPEKVAPLHPLKFGNVHESFCHFQRVRFWHLKSGDFLETRGDLFLVRGLGCQLVVG